jgi:hypothetical protein
MTRDERRMWDVRVLERNLRRGLISRKDYDRYLKSLPDSVANAAVSRPEEQEGEHARASERHGSPAESGGEHGASGGET